MSYARDRWDAGRRMCSGDGGPGTSWGGSPSRPGSPIGRLGIPPYTRVPWPDVRARGAPVVAPDPRGGPDKVWSGGRRHGRRPNQPGFTTGPRPLSRLASLLDPDNTLSGPPRKDQDRLRCWVG